MATKNSGLSQITYQSSGIYFQETDLTIVASTAGGFSAGLIGLTERGPAFDISNSSTFSDRLFRLGGLNPKFPTSYYARQYLEQARNFKEVRILGLEGYSDTVGFAISLDVNSSTPAVPGTAALELGINTLVCVLKKRSTNVTGRASVTGVSVEAVTYVDPTTNISTTASNDYLFGLRITYSDSTNELVTTSLRPESNEYIVKKFGRDPLDSPLIRNNIASLWIDFIIPSVKSRPTIASQFGYYLPGSNVSQPNLPILIGNMLFGTGITLQSAAITNVVTSSSATTVTLTGDVTSWLSNNDYLKITNVTGTNISTVNNTWIVSNVTLVSGNTTAKLINPVDGTPFIIQGSTTFNAINSPIGAEFANPTWETQILDFSDIAYQTPISPWFISDGDVNGDFKRLFRIWEISDGKTANSEIKIEIRNINPTTNNGNGSFDLIVRDWADREDQSQSVIESYINVNMIKDDDNYIFRRIGDGESFPLRSKFIFIEMNVDEQIEDNLIPWGCYGYPNVEGGKFVDVQWTLDYDKTQPINKQTLGLSNNSINTYRVVTEDQLAFKRPNGSVVEFGLGFHLNPNNNTALVSHQSANFSFAPSTIYNDVQGRIVSLQEKTKRNKFVVDFYGGFDGFNVYSTRTWGDITSKDYEALQLAIELFADKESLDADFTVLVTPDMFLDTDAAACEAVLEMVQTRGDALYIPDLSYDETADVFNATALVTESNMLTNSTAIYFPWCQIEDTTNKINKWLPPSLLALGTITYVANNEQVWQPPGGSIRTVTNNLVRTRKRLKLDDRESLKSAYINPITLFPGSGYEITEVRTTQPYFSALSFIHNRLLLCYAKKVLNQILRPLLFQLNNQVTKDAFVSTVRPIFDRIKKLNGVDDFSVNVVDRPELNDKTTIYGEIVIIPLYPVERIITNFILQDNALSFNS